MAARRGHDLRQSFKGRAQPGLHGHGVEVAADAHDQLAADGAIMPGLQVLHGDRADGGQLGLPGVGTVGSIDQLGGFAAGDLLFVVVAPDNARSLLLLGQFQFFGTEFGVQKQVQSQGKDLVRIALERIPGKSGRIHVSAGLDVCGLGFEQIVQRIAV